MTQPMTTREEVASRCDGLDREGVIDLLSDVVSTTRLEHDLTFADTFPMALPRQQRALLGILYRRRGQVVPYDAIDGPLQIGRATNPHALNSLKKRLVRKIRDTGWTVRAVYDEGYVLEKYDEQPKAS